MIRGKRDLKSSVPVGKNKKAKNGDSSLKNDNSSIIKKKVKFITSPQCKKIGLKKKVKAKDTKSQETCENFNVSEEHNNNSSECQSERLNLMLNESKLCPTLTQNELRILFMKYKLDGHFEANKNLPPITALLDTQQNTVNYKNYLYNETRHVPTVDTHYSNYSGNEDTFDNSYYNNAIENQQNGEYNAYKHQENHTNKIHGIRGGHVPNSLANVENIFPEARGSLQCKNKDFPYNAQYEHFQNVSKSSQQHNNNYGIQYFNQPWNSSIYKNFHGQDWDSNMSSSNRNENYQLWRSENSDCIPKTNHSECQYDVNNHLEQNVWNMHSPNTTYPLMTNENSDYAATINYNDCMHQDINTNTSASSFASNNFVEPVSFLSSFTNVIN